MRRMFVLAAALLMLLSIGVTPAAAQPPDNDEVTSATVVDALPFAETIDTSEATTAPDDPDCVGQGPTVWYSFTPTDDTFIVADTFGSDYDTTLSVYVGDPGNLEQIACNDDSRDLQSLVRFPAEADVRYLLMVGAFDSGPGGDLTFRVRETDVPPLELDVTVDPVGNHRRGVATISGTVTCNRPAEVELDATLRQRAGRLLITGFAFDFVECDGTVPWEFTIDEANGLFAGGSADVDLFAFAFDPETGEDSFEFVEEKIRLRGGRRR